MKKLILGLILISSCAYADTQECTRVLNVMTDLTNNYIDVLKSCRQLEQSGDTGSRHYEGYRRIARDAERLHSQAAAQCRLVCDDTFFCDGELSGACQ